MPYYYKSVDNYQIHYHSLIDGTIQISCVSGSEWVCSLFFYDDTRMPTANGFVGPARVPSLAFRRSQFQDVLTLLREEKPIYFTYTTETMKGGLQTNPEPVGEDEGP